MTQELIWEAEYYESLCECDRMPLIEGDYFYNDIKRRIGNYVVVRQGVITSGFEPDKRLEARVFDKKVTEAQLSKMSARVTALLSDMLR